MKKKHIVEIVNIQNIQKAISAYEENGYSLVPPIIPIKTEIRTETFFLLTFENEQ